MSDIIQPKTAAVARAAAPVDVVAKAAAIPAGFKVDLDDSGTDAAKSQTSGRSRWPKDRDWAEISEAEDAEDASGGPARDAEDASGSPASSEADWERPGSVIGNFLLSDRLPSETSSSSTGVQPTAKKMPAEGKPVGKLAEGKPVVLTPRGILKNTGAPVEKGSVARAAVPVVAEAAGAAGRSADEHHGRSRPPISDMETRLSDHGRSRTPTSVMEMRLGDHGRSRTPISDEEMRLKDHCRFMETRLKDHGRSRTPSPDLAMRLRAPDGPDAYQWRGKEIGWKLRQLKKGDPTGGHHCGLGPNAKANKVKKEKKIRSERRRVEKGVADELEPIIAAQIARVYFAKRHADGVMGTLAHPPRTE